MRVPKPAAMTTAPRLLGSVLDIGSWGARIRTWDHGTKTRCLTTWPRPTEGPGTLAGAHVASGQRPAEPRRPDAVERGGCAPRGRLVLEQAVDRGTCTRDIRTERPQPDELVRERRPGEVVPRQARE